MLFIHFSQLFFIEHIIQTRNAAMYIEIGDKK